MNTNLITKSAVAGIKHVELKADLESNFLGACTLTPAGFFNNCFTINAIDTQFKDLVETYHYENKSEYEFDLKQIKR